MTYVVIFVHSILAFLVMLFVLMHSGRDSGLGSLGGGAQSTGQHVMERNLDRITVIAALGFVATTFALHALYK